VEILSGLFLARDSKKTEGAGWELVKRCPSCAREVADCRCPASPGGPLPPSKQRPKFRLEKRRGKPVTVITHLSLSEADYKKLAGTLKGRLGCGGSAKEGEVELQGDHRETLPTLLRELGFKA
jgi:translation initiation factor 1